MELKCEVWHKPECRYNKLPRSTNTESGKKCNCGADDILAFINYQSLQNTRLSADLKAKTEEVEEQKLMREDAEQNVTELQEALEKIKKDHQDVGLK